MGRKLESDIDDDHADVHDVRQPLGHVLCPCARNPPSQPCWLDFLAPTKSAVHRQQNATYNMQSAAMRAGRRAWQDAPVLLKEPPLCSPCSLCSDAMACWKPRAHARVSVSAAVRNTHTPVSNREADTAHPRLRGRGASGLISRSWCVAHSQEARGIPAADARPAATGSQRR